MNPNKKALALYGTLLGLLVLVIAIALKPSPPVNLSHSRAVLVDTIVLNKTSLAPSIEGFGRVAPKQAWDAIAEVSGKVIYRHPQLESGRMLPKGVKVLAIDPLEYQFKLAQAQAALHSTQAQLTRLEQQQRNLNASLKIESQKLVLAEQEYQRKLSLKKRQLVSSSELESQNQALLVQTKMVEDLQSSLKLLPDDTKVTLAQLNVDEAKLQDAQRKLAQTQVFLPFEARIATVNVEIDQVVTQGMTMLSAHKLGAAEIKAEVSLSDMRTLVSSLAQLPKEPSLPSVELLDLSATVNLHIADHHFQWPAQVTRIAERVDPNQASLGLYLEVAQDYHQLDLLKSPPLTILLVQYIRHHVDEGDDVTEAVVSASRERFRAVILTSLTTAAGLLSLLLETSLQAQIVQPLVVSIVCGIFASTLMVLFVIPCAYAILDDFDMMSKHH
ncbi:efflux RND transporter periplasmic adaptor subunit [Shewanella sp. SR44-3]|uniref:efflux RND transporter periplasmic adaptor subunit n=1 Tax=Shewanella sp. SR44-3 TaxID=2760936 RepID=UPI002175C1A6|nr:efflux RND transporter permease subunit [Shewanella sp. SR44-3]